MAQRFVTFLMMFCCMLAPAHAENARTTPTTPPPATKPYKSPEERFLAAQACLKKTDIPCAQVQLAGIPPPSPYAKILDAQLAAQRQDDERVLHLLIPLQSAPGLSPAALGSLHATLAQAYDRQGNVLPALEQRAAAGRYLDNEADIVANQQAILRSLVALPKDTLLEMRGESGDTATQGWVDLALALAHNGTPAAALGQWRKAYPDHEAREAIAMAFAGASAAPARSSLGGKIALLLPLETPAFAFAAEAVRSGFLAAKQAAGSNAEITLYPTHGIPEDIPALYAQAVAEGAGYVVGPLTRGEVAGLQNAAISVPTLALNTLEETTISAPKLVQFGLPVEDEAVQLARLARSQGMLTAVVVAADTPLAQRMAQAFVSEWTEQGGVVALQTNFSEQSNLLDLKNQIAQEPSDMIFLAADADEAHLVRPYLNQSIPTFALSHINDGNAKNPANGTLHAVHFIDMPWMLAPDDAEYASYRETAATLSPEEKRWFAVGVDAWKILTAMAGDTSGKWRLRGLTGTLTLADNRVRRELPLAQFRSDGIFLE